MYVYPVTHVSYIHMYIYTTAVLMSCDVQRKASE